MDFFIERKENPVSEQGKPGSKQALDILTSWVFFLLYKTEKNKWDW